MTPTTTTAADAEVARAFLRAVVSRDGTSGGCAGCSPTTCGSIRAMLVREVVEGHDAETALELFHGWFGAAAEIQVLLATTSPVATREAVTYRLRLRPVWAPAVWHVIEQTGYLRVRDGRIRRIDLVCTGFVPEPELPPGVGSAPPAGRPYPAVGGGRSRWRSRAEGGDDTG